MNNKFCTERLLELPKAKLKADVINLAREVLLKERNLICEAEVHALNNFPVIKRKNFLGTLIKGDLKSF